MAIRKAVQLGISVGFDGVSTSFSFDLTKDCYGVTTGDPNGLTEGNALEVENWFTRNKLFNPPTSISPTGTTNGVNFTSTLSGNIITVNFDSPPPGGGLVVITIFF